MTTRRPTISAVIPAYNSAKTLGTAIESVLDQTVSVDQIIVVDDGSGDSTSDVARSYSAVHLIRQPNAGPGPARNRAVREATGDWIAFLDADDAWLPQKTERQIPFLTDDYSLVHSYTLEDRPADQTDDAITFDVLWRYNYIGTSTVMMQRQVYNELGGFDPDRALIGCEDYHLWLPLLHAGHRVYTLREALTRYTPSEGNISSQTEVVMDGHLEFLRRVSEDLQLPKPMIRSKLAALYEEYGRSSLWMRNLPLARKYLGAATLRRPTPSNVVHWLATFLPSSVLDLRRRYRAATSA